MEKFPAVVLAALDVASRLSERGRQRWARLVPFAEPKNEDAIRQIRNCMAFHLGEESIVRRGIDRLSQEDVPLTIASADGPESIEGRHDFAGAVLLAGIDVRPPNIPKGTPNARRRITDEDVVAAIGEASEFHFAVLDLFEDIFVDVLREGGALFSSLPPLAPTDAE